jgi:hypothetical protein
MGAEGRRCLALARAAMCGGLPALDLRLPEFDRRAGWGGGGLGEPGGWRRRGDAADRVAEAGVFLRELGAFATLAQAAG